MIKRVKIKVQVGVLWEAKEKHDLLVVTPTQSVQDFCLEAGIPVRAFPLCSDTWRFATICKQDAVYRQAVEKAYSELEMQKPDILLTAGFYAYNMVVSISFSIIPIELHYNPM